MVDSSRGFSSARFVVAFSQSNRLLCVLCKRQPLWLITDIQAMAIMPLSTLPITLTSTIMVTAALRRLHSDG